MKEYQIEVKAWMLKESTDDFDFMQKFNRNIPMPLMVMFTGGKIDETAKMIKVWLHGDIKQRTITRCMGCGRPITNKISQYFGLGPICGEHNYVNPFDTEDELNEAISNFRTKLVNTTWVGWLPISAITAIDDVTDPMEIRNIIEDMPIEIFDDISEDTSTNSSDSDKFIINVKVDKPILGIDDFSAFVSCGYNKQVVDTIKSIRKDARRYNPDTKVWEIAYSELGSLMANLPDCRFHIENEDIVPDKVELPADTEFKTVPMHHQVEGVEYGLSHSRWLLADEQGLGKTKQIIDLAVIRKNAMGFKHCLILCGVNSLKWNWLEEIGKHSNEVGHILGQSVSKRTGKLSVKGNPEKTADLDRLLDGDTEFPYFIITNIESLRNNAIATKLKQLCDNGTVNMVAFDECHRAKCLTTQQGAGLLQIQPDYRIAMTGTPLINTPLDLFAILKWLGYEPYEFGQFKYHFCEIDEFGNIAGYKNIDQLREQLNAIMLRRTKKEVLDLPEKVYINEYVELTTEQKSLYNQVIDRAIEDPEFADVKISDCLLAVKMRLRQVSSGIGPFGKIAVNPKLDRMEQIVEEAVYSGTKAIVFSNWVKEINPAVERLEKYNPLVITGETKDADRQAIVNRFQTDNSVKVICCTIGAAGVGITLTAATEVIFLSEPWTNADKEQAIDRCHRIGTKYNITVHTIMGHGTYDEEVHNIVLGKKALSDTFVERKDMRKWKIS